jgi:hypothetical protein
MNCIVGSSPQQDQKVIHGTQKILYQVHKVKGGGSRVRVNIS